MSLLSQTNSVSNLSPYTIYPHLVYRRKLILRNSESKTFFAKEINCKMSECTIITSSRCK